MEYRLGCLSLVFALTGCFSDPPSSGGSGGSTSSSTGAGSSGQGSESTETAADSTGQPEGTSTGVVDGSSGSSGFECELFDFDVPSVESDVVVLIDEGASLDVGSLLSGGAGLVGPGTNVAVLVPQDQAPEVKGIPCDLGCGMCDQDPAVRVITPYTGSAIEALTATEEYACILREPPPGNPTSGPTKHLWLITDDPLQELPPEFMQTVAALSLRVHLSCPMCDENFGNVSGALMAAVENTLGTVSNSNNPMAVGVQADLIAASRLSCGWASAELPPLVVAELQTGEEKPEYLFLAEVDGEGACSPEGFYVEEGSGPDLVFRLCPQPCTIVQTLPEQAAGVFGCQ
ncbi:MAG: hypothetical protein ACE37F_20845 [Nannocystaceae bacterium]|nr:hypothetical protein [bacterium]